ncbi:hypothetical protein ACWDTI_16095 [Gordonia sp. NPDC003424]
MPIAESDDAQRSASATPPSLDDRRNSIPDPGGARGSASALIFLGVGALVVLLLVVTVVVGPTRVDLPTGHSAQHTPSMSTTLSASSWSPTPTPEPSVAAIDGGPGPVAGNNFSAADDPYKVGPKNMPFAFAFPAGWDCMYSTLSSVNTTGGYTCFQSDRTTGGGESRVGGRIGYQRCAAVCTPAEIAEVGTQMRIVPDDWRQIDPSTTFAERTGEMADNPMPQTRVGMRYAYAPGGRGEPTVIAFAVLTGDSGFRDTMLKVLNSVRANAR